MFSKKRAKDERYCLPENKGWNNDLSSRVLGNTHVFNDAELIKFELAISSCARGVWGSVDGGEIDNLDFFAKYWTSRYEFIPCQLFLVEKEKQDAQACGELRFTSDQDGTRVIPKLQFQLFVTPEESYCLKECFIEMALKQGRSAPIRLFVERPEGFEVKVNHLGWTHSDPLPIKNYWTASYLDLETIFTPYDKQVDNFLSSFGVTKDRPWRPEE